MAFASLASNFTYLMFSFFSVKYHKHLYGKLPAKEAEAIPWDRLSVDLVGPYKITREGRDDPLILKSLTSIDPETGWFEIVCNNDKQAAKISNLVEQTWLCNYPGPIIIMYNR